MPPTPGSIPASDWRAAPERRDPPPRGLGIRRRIKRWPTTVKVGAVIFGILALAALFAPLIAPYGPNEIDPFALLSSPSGQHLFGTDDTGRDVFSRTLYGLRLDILLALLVTYVPLPFAVVARPLAR